MEPGDCEGCGEYGQLVDGEDGWLCQDCIEDLFDDESGAS